MIRKQIFIVLGCLAGLSAGTIRSETVAAKYAGEFMATGVGARGLAMGGAYVAAAHDVTAIYWNPAGLTGCNALQIHGMHSERFAGIINWDFAGVAMPFRKDAAIGLGFVRLGVDDIPVTLLTNPNLELGETYIDSEGNQRINVPYIDRYIDDAEMALMFSYARRYHQRITFGGTVKVIRKSSGPGDAWGLGFDFGIRVMPWRALQAGAVLKDATSTMIAWSSGRKEMVLPQLHLGAAYPLVFRSFSVLPVLDIVFSAENRQNAAQIHAGALEMDTHGGVEISFINRAALRFGVDRGRWTVGGGFNLQTISVDYGFMQHADLGGSHRVSLTVLITPWKKNSMADREEE